MWVFESEYLACLWPFYYFIFIVLGISTARAIRLIGQCHHGSEQLLGQIPLLTFVASHTAANIVGYEGTRRFLRILRRILRNSATHQHFGGNCDTDADLSHTYSISGLASVSVRMSMHE